MGDWKAYIKLTDGATIYQKEIGPNSLYVPTIINLKVWLIHRIEIERLPMVQKQPNVSSR